MSIRMILLSISADVCRILPLFIGLESSGPSCCRMMYKEMGCMEMNR